MESLRPILDWFQDNRMAYLPVAAFVFLAFLSWKVYRGSR
jgi:hypothetical protein